MLPFTNWRLFLLILPLSPFHVDRTAGQWRTQERIGVGAHLKKNFCAPPKCEKPLPKIIFIKGISSGTSIGSLFEQETHKAKYRILFDTIF
jgi:hypothetical protein